MASFFKTPADLQKYKTHCQELLSLANSGNVDALNQIREHVDTVILRMLGEVPFWSNRPSSFDLDQADKKCVLENDIRLCDVYRRALDINS